MTRFIGLDLGQSQDYTALCIIEPVRRPPVYDVRHIDRYPLGTPYTEIVESVQALLAAPEMRDQPALLALDATGVGTPVTDMFRAQLREAYLLPVKIHGGDTETRSNAFYRVPKRELVSRAVALLQRRQLRIAPALAHAKTLEEELRNFKLKINIATGHDSYEAWRERDHDDLVLALCIALWAAQRGSFTPRLIRNVVR